MADFSEERVNQLKALAEQLTENPELAISLPEEDVADLRKFVNPYGSKLREKEMWVNMSIINWNHQHMKKMLTTGMVGFVYRMQFEYEPVEELKTIKEYYDKLKENPGADAKALNAECEKDMKAITKTARNLIRRFLDRHFEYNPDKHLRAAPINPTGDPEREKLVAEANDLEKIRMQCETIEHKIREKPEALAAFVRGNCLAGYQSAVALNLVATKLASMADDVAAGKLPAEDFRAIAVRERQKISKIAAEFSKIAEPLARVDVARPQNPPDDVFHQFTRYFENHYKQFQDTCAALYGEKSDIEFAIRVYSAHNSEDAARDYCESHSKEFTADVLTISNVGTTLLGPFKENRDRVNYYNTNTVLLREMDKQAERDHRLGKDLMEKEVKKKKRENVAETGEDSPELSQYIKTASSAASKGKRVLSEEEREKIAESVRAAEDMVVPDDAIQMNVYETKYDHEGEAVMTRRKFYTQAEEPLHMQQGSPFHEKYQPKKTIKSRKGEIKVIDKTSDFKRSLEPAE